MTVTAERRLDTGTTVKVEDQGPIWGGPVVTLWTDDPDCPEDLQGIRVGRIVTPDAGVTDSLGLQTPMAPFAMRPAVLRAIADLIEEIDPNHA